MEKSTAIIPYQAPKTETAEESKYVSWGKMGGRPITYTPSLLKEKVDEYIAHCEPHVERKLTEVKQSDGSTKVENIERIVRNKPTITGFCWFSQFSKDTFYRMADEPGFSDSVRLIKAYCEAYAEDLLLDPFNRNSSGVIFNLKNNFGWVDETTQNQKHSIVNVKELYADIRPGLTEGNPGTPD